MGSCLTVEETVLNDDGTTEVVLRARSDRAYMAKSTFFERLCDFYDEYNPGIFGRWGEKHIHEVAEHFSAKEDELWSSVYQKFEIPEDEKRWNTDEATASTSLYDRLIDFYTVNKPLIFWSMGNGKVTELAQNHASNAPVLWRALYTKYRVPEIAQIWHHCDLTTAVKFTAEEEDAIQDEGDDQQDEAAQTTQRNQLEDLSAEKQKEILHNRKKRGKMLKHHAKRVAKQQRELAKHAAEAPELAKLEKRNTLMEHRKSKKRKLKLNRAMSKIKEDRKKPDDRVEAMTDEFEALTAQQQETEKVEDEAAIDAARAAIMVRLNKRSSNLKISAL